MVSNAADGQHICRFRRISERRECAGALEGILFIARCIQLHDNSTQDSSWQYRIAVAGFVFHDSSVIAIPFGHLQQSQRLSGAQMPEFRFVLTESLMVLTTDAVTAGDAEVQGFANGHELGNRHNPLQVNFAKGCRFVQIDELLWANGDVFRVVFSMFLQGACKVACVIQRPEQLPDLSGDVARRIVSRSLRGGLDVPQSRADLLHDHLLYTAATSVFRSSAVFLDGGQAED